VLKSIFDFCVYSFKLLEVVYLPIAIISILIILIYYLYFFTKLYLHKDITSNFEHPISIVICAKNEFQNLKRNLPLILSQNYFEFEVIVVNDHSTDESSFYLEEMSQNNKNLVVVDLNDSVTDTLGKKFALTLGIKTAKYEHLLLTDADCIPNSKNWAKMMSSNFVNSEIIIGYGAYKKTKGFLNKLIRFDTFQVALQYLSYALAGFPYMGVGRNLAYKKSLFFKNKGFASHLHIASGDDDLFIQEIVPKRTVSIEISDSSHTTSEVLETWQAWIYQKRRHLSASSMYKNRFKILLSIYPLAQFIFFICIFLLIILKIDLLIAGFLIGIKLSVSYILNYRIMKRLNLYDLYLLHPIYEIVHLFIQIFFVFLNINEKPKQWSK